MEEEKLKNEKEILEKEENNQFVVFKDKNDELGKEKLLRIIIENSGIIFTIYSEKGIETINLSWKAWERMYYYIINHKNTIFKTNKPKKGEENKKKRKKKKQGRW